MDTFGQTFRRIREQSGKTQTEIADLLGTNIMQVSRMENDEKPPLGFATIRKLLSVIGRSDDAPELLSSAAKSMGNVPLPVVGNDRFCIESMIEFSMLCGKLSHRQWEAILILARE